MSNATQQQKAKQRREKFADLLREMFQLNQPELDFGLYRIMHARKDDINRFIEQDLPSITQQAFSQFASQDKTQLEAELEKARKAAEDAGFSAEDSPKVKELQAQLKEGFDLAREEGEVYDALVTFFNRYYSEGDFLSRRVYKDGTYAIPYQGEEVVLHWANKDQYYIKSSETLRDYSFRLNPDAGPGEDPMRVHFKLVDADAGAKDNNKESADNKRVFVLDAEQPFELIAGEPNNKGDIYPELQCRFFFRAATEADWTDREKAKATEAAGKKTPSQEALRTIAVERLLGDDTTLPEPWKTALAQTYRKADGELADYSMLAGQLNNYTKKNTFDYFIHKDLGAFLTRELDFYIKNELLDWADIASLKNDPARLGPLLSKIEVIRSLGEKIIAFLAQLENFQKKLWLKKKFVTETNYCITLDLVPKELYPEIVANERQWSQWNQLGVWDGDAPGSIEALKAAPYRMVDTSLFNDVFTNRLISMLQNLSEVTGGILVHGDNFQAIRLLSSQFQKSIGCTYIDPPYNAPNSQIAYKNNFKHSSFLSLIHNRLEAWTSLASDDGALVVAIDKNEENGVSRVIGEMCPENDNVLVTIEHNRKGVQGDHFSHTNEYAIFSIPHARSDLNQVAREEDEYEYSNLRNWGGESLRSDAANCFYPIYVKNSEVVGFGDVWVNADHHPEAANIQREDGLVEVFPIDGKGVERKWRYERGTVESIRGRLKVEVGKNGVIQIKIAKVSDQFKTVWYSPKYNAGDNGTQLARQMGIPIGEFDYPKSIYTTKDCVFAVSGSDDWILDYFAGSGTTGQAVITLNRESHDSNRRYILVEQGEYFDRVLRARIQKSVFSASWSDGKPTAAGTGISHCVKFLKLESYEDTLGNLALKRSTVQQQLLSDIVDSSNTETRQAYVMNYMLEVETRGSQSLLNTQQFIDPTQYKLNVRSAGGDETRPVNVDLLETFNYLLGLTVEHIAAPIYFDAELSQGEYGRWQAKVKRSESGEWWFRTVYGTNRAGQQVLVVWRNLPSVINGTEDGIKLDNAVLDAVLIEKLAIRLTESQDDEVDVLYVNGDHNIAIPRNRKGEFMEQARIQLIEEAFHRLMFADTEQGA